MKFLRDITEFIFLEDLPKKADIIIVPGNTWPQPARRAAALYQAGMAPYIVVSGRYSKGRSAFEGTSCDRECYKGPYAAEADFLMLEEKHLPIKRAIICCQAFHARRCRMYFEYVFQDREIEFLMCPAVTQGISRDNWAESKKGLETVLGELRRCGEQFSWMLQ